MMPTVGCEADAIAFIEEGTSAVRQRSALSPTAAPAALPEQEPGLRLAAFSPDGSYVLGAPGELPSGRHWRAP